MPTRHILDAALWILNTSAQWHMLPQCYPNYKTVHRRLQRWCEQEVLRDVLCALANEWPEQGGLDERECLVNPMFTAAVEAPPGAENARGASVAARPTGSGALERFFRVFNGTVGSSSGGNTMCAMFSALCNSLAH